MRIARIIASIGSEKIDIYASKTREYFEFDDNGDVTLFKKFEDGSGVFPVLTIKKNVPMILYHD